MVGRHLRPYGLRGRLVLLFQPAEERHSARNPMGGAIRMIRDKAAGEELCKALGVPVVTRPQVDPSCDEDVNNIDGRDDSMDQALLGRTHAILKAEAVQGDLFLF